jgi:DNA-binding MarR family transcriptional regulator
MGILFDRPQGGRSSAWEGDPDLAAQATELLHHDRLARELRRTIFDSAVINDSCWHILQDLFAAHLAGEDVRVKHLVLTSGLPQTTVLRYLDHLEAFAAIHREEDPTDSRGKLITLTRAGRVWLCEFYEQLALHKDTPLRLPRNEGERALMRPTE